MKRTTVVTVLGIALAPLAAFGILVVMAVASVTSAADGQSSATTNTAEVLASGSVPAAYAGLVSPWGGLCPALTPAILAAQIQQESGWNPNARSSAGAEGIAQFMPSTWAVHGIDADHNGSTNIWDPNDAIPSAATYDCALAKDVARVPGDPTANMLAAYNASPQAVIDAQGIPPNPQTQQYVQRIEQSAHAFAVQPAAGSGAAQVAIQAALAEQGVPYSWGGGGAHGPTRGSCCSPSGQSGATVTGFDCSGLTQYAYAQAGIVLPRTAAGQAGVGRRIPASAGLAGLQPGDLVFFAYEPGVDATIHHVGIYLGNGRMINAARPGTPVKIDPVDGMPGFAGGTRLA